MKTLFRWFYKLTMKDYDAKVASAKMTRRMIVESTKGSINHFYDMSGEQIRGYSNTVIRTRNIHHPLINKYQ